MAKSKAAAEPDMAALRRKITDLIAQNAVGMVQRAIDSVNDEGQYQAIKYLFEMIGLYPAGAGSEEEIEESLTQRLLEHLGLETSSLEPNKGARPEMPRPLSSSDVPAARIPIKNIPVK